MTTECSETPRPCGYIAIVGRPNVGKSTLLNHLLGQKLSITSRKPQTTRHQIVGVKTTDAAQMIFVDTPGLHKEEPKALNRYMNQAASSALTDVDLVVFVISGLTWNELDQWVLEKIQRAKKPTLLLINKVDQIEKKERLLPFIDERQKEYDYGAIIPISALKEHNLEALEKELIHYLPQSPLLFPEDQITDRTQRFFCLQRSYGRRSCGSWVMSFRTKLRSRLSSFNLKRRFGVFER